MFTTNYKVFRPIQNRLHCRRRDRWSHEDVVANDIFTSRPRPPPAHNNRCPTNTGDLSDTSEVALRHFEIKLSVYIISIRSDPYLSILPDPGGGGRRQTPECNLVDFSAILVGREDLLFPRFSLQLMEEWGAGRRRSTTTTTWRSH